MRADKTNILLGCMIAIFLCFFGNAAVKAAAPLYFEIESAYSPPEGSYGISGLAWDGKNLWSCNEQTGKIYKHNMDDVLSVQSEYNSPGGSPYGLAWDGTNLWSCDWATNKIYKHKMDTNLSVSAEYEGLAKRYLVGLAWDGNNLWSCDADLTGMPYTKIRRHNMDSTLSIGYEADGPACDPIAETRGFSFSSSDGYLWSTNYFEKCPALYRYNMDASLTVADSYMIPGFDVMPYCWSDSEKECNGGWTGIAWVKDRLWISNYFIGDSIYPGKAIYMLRPVFGTIEVIIDIKPGSSSNPINLKSRGKVPVAILTTDDFDASDVDPVLCRFAGAEPIDWEMGDTDKDGDDDMLLFFLTQELDLSTTSTEATLQGETFDGLQFNGTDSVKIVPKVKKIKMKIKKRAVKER